MRRRDLLATAAALTLPVPAIGATVPAPILLGAQTHFAQNWPLDVIDHAQAAGLPLKFVRDEMFWRQSERSPGVYNTTQYDPYVNKLRAAGLKLLLELFNVNPLYDGGKFPSSPEAQDAFAAYAAYLVRTYGNDLIAIEVWNEPNGSFSGGLTSAQLVKPYVSACAKVYAAIKAIRTDIPVLVGSSVLVACQWHKALIAEGILPHCDGISFHPYQTPENVEPKIKELRALVGDSKQLWATEFGNINAVATEHYRKLLPILAASGVIGASAYALRQSTQFPQRGLLTEAGAITNAGNAFKTLGTGMLLKPVTRRVSPLVPHYVGGSTHVAWTRLGRTATLGGQPLGPMPTIGTGTFVESGPTVRAELLRDFGKQITYHVYDGGAEVGTTESGFPFDTQRQGPGIARLNEGQCHPGITAEPAYRWKAKATATYLVHGAIARTSTVGDGVVATVYARGVPVWTVTVLPGARVAFVGRVANLVVGQTVELRIGCNVTTTNDATSVELAITADSPGVTGLDFSI